MKAFIPLLLVSSVLAYDPPEKPKKNTYSELSKKGSFLIPNINLGDSSQETFQLSYSQIDYLMCYADALLKEEGSCLMLDAVKTRDSFYRIEAHPMSLTTEDKMAAIAKRNYFAKRVRILGGICKDKSGQVKLAYIKYECDEGDSTIEKHDVLSDIVGGASTYNVNFNANTLSWSNTISATG